MEWLVPWAFYKNVFVHSTDQAQCDIWDALVTDVHKDLPDPLFRVNLAQLFTKALRTWIYC